jgi:hypothetical protein
MDMEKAKLGELTVRITGPEGAAIQIGIVAGKDKERLPKFRKMIDDHLDGRFEELATSQ